MRAPSIDKGVSAFWWAFFFFLYLFFFMLAVGVAKGSAFIFSALLGFGIFFYVASPAKTRLGKFPDFRAGHDIRSRELVMRIDP